MTRRAVQPALPLVVPAIPATVRAELQARIMPGWAGSAACASTRVDPDWWHAPAGDELQARIMPGWAGSAACASTRVDPDWWHAPAGDELQTVARGICAGCPVRRSCLAHALAAGEPDGIWGGFDESERVWLRLALAEGTRVPAVLDPPTRTAAA